MLTAAGGFVHVLKVDPDMADEDVTIDYCLENIVIAGSPQTVADRLAAEVMPRLRANVRWRDEAAD